MDTHSEEYQPEDETPGVADEDWRRNEQTISLPTPDRYEPPDRAGWEVPGQGTRNVPGPKKGNPPPGKGSNPSVKE
jgi:hypothetical protein